MQVARIRAGRRHRRGDGALHERVRVADVRDVVARVEIPMAALVDEVRAASAHDETPSQEAEREAEELKALGPEAIARKKQAEHEAEPNPNPNPNLDPNPNPNPNPKP